MIGLDKLQVLTFLMGVIVVLCTIIVYQSTDLDNAFHRLIDLLSNGLAFFFIAYSICVNVETDKSGYKDSRSMYTGFLVLTSVVAWALWIFGGRGVVTAVGADGERFQADDSSGDTKWNRVALEVARPLALGSMFVLPYIFSSF